MLDYIKSKISSAGGLIAIKKVSGYCFTDDTVIIFFEEELGIGKIAYPITF